MPNRERAERAVRGRVAVAADDRHPGLRDAELRADHVDDALAAAAGRVERDAELLAVAAQRLELLLGELVRRAVDRRHVVIHRRERPVRPAHAAAGQAQPLERLRRGDLVDQVQVDVEQRRLARRLGDDVPLPDLLEQRPCHAVTLVCKASKAECPGDRAPPHPRPPAVRVRGDRRAQAASCGATGSTSSTSASATRTSPSPEVAVEKLREAAAKPRNHRYSASRGIPNLRQAICELYERRFGVALDPEREAITTIGAKEGLAHLLWVLVEPGDAALVPAPSYPIHMFAPAFAGATVEQVAMGTDEDVLANLADAYERTRPRPRVVIASFPHNPTTTVVDAAFMQALVDFARERDGRRARLRVRGHRVRRARAAVDPRGRGRDGRAPSSSTRSRRASRWRAGASASASATRRSSPALGRLKSYLDYGTFQPIQIAATVTMREAAEYPLEVCEIYRGRRDALCDGLARLGWEVPRPQGTMFVWAPIPEPFRELGSHEFALRAAARGERRRSARAAGSARAATATSASRSSRTSSGSARRCAASGACSRRR